MGSAVLILCSFVDEMGIFLLFSHTRTKVSTCLISLCAPTLLGCVPNAMHAFVWNRLSPCSYYFLQRLGGLGEKVYLCSGNE